jgi:hypothetical protein
MEATEALGRQRDAVIRRRPGLEVGSVKAAVRAIDSNLFVEDLRTLTSDEAAFRSTTLHAVMPEAFAALAILLAAIGVYASMAYSVAQRTRELAGQRSLSGLHTRLSAPRPAVPLGNRCLLEILERNHLRPLCVARMREEHHHAVVG